MSDNFGSCIESDSRYWVQYYGIGIGYREWLRGCSRRRNLSPPQGIQSSHFLEVCCNRLQKGVYCRDIDEI